MTEPRFFSKRFISLMDPILVAAVCWPPLLFLNQSFPAFISFDFWQAYYLTLPHRWLTLVVVTADPDRRKNLGWWLPASFIATAIVVSGIWISSGTLLCLAIADHIWNAWHFGSQHAGISRMYGLKFGQNRPLFDKWSMRLLVFYALVRPVEWSFKWINPNTIASTLLGITDIIFVALASGMILLTFWPGQKKAIPRIFYITSISALYGWIILACQFSTGRFLAWLLFSSSIVHAWEYIAFISTYSANRSNAAGLIGKLARNWGAFLLMYLTFIGTLGVLAEAYPGSARLWILLNLWAAFTHYWLDGMIWKFRDRRLSRDMAGSL